MAPLAAMAVAALFMMFHGLGAVQVVEEAPATARVMSR